MAKVKVPAYMNMTRDQLQASIELGRRILEGEVDLVELDNRSLELRRMGMESSGKASRLMAGPSSGKRKREDANGIRGEGVKKGGNTPSSSSLEESDETLLSIPSAESGTHKPDNSKEDLTPYLKKIALSDKTPFQKKVLTVLCQVPRGRYTTYAAISKHLSSSPRAVGNALKNNPFAPQVPCHRVLASGGGIGGFHGSWGRNGKEGLNDDKKRKLLRDEGVRFDGKGRVVGTAWDAFKY
jgi:methylated-DNA-[protein]-cysteine S-methyltransferase